MHDYTGEQYGKWTVLCFDKRTSSGYSWKVQCRCGRIASRKIAGIKRGDSSSCTSCGNTTHNLTGTYIAGIYGNIVQRCRNPNMFQYPDYGGRGIQICRHISSPSVLLELVGHRPGNNFSLDRIDNSGHYSCGSCDQCLANKWPLNIRWATKVEQMSNRRGNIRVTMNGENKTLTQWARIMGIHPNTLKNKIKRGKVVATMSVTQ